MKHQTPDRSTVQAIGVDRVNSKKVSGYKEQWRGFLPSTIFTAVRKKVLHLNLFVANGTDLQLETNLQSCEKVESKWWNGQKRIEKIESNRVHRLPLCATIQLSSPVTLALHLLCFHIVKMNSPGPRLCVIKAHWRCRELSTLNLNYLHTEPTNCGRLEAVNLIQFFPLLLFCPLLTSLLFLTTGCTLPQALPVGKLGVFYS